MITAPTVLILGAGASAPYGSPLGPQLKDLILKDLQMPFEESEYIHRFYLDKYNALSKAISVSDPDETIDKILVNCPSLAEMGKYAIAMALTKAQNHDNVFPAKDPARDWYRHLFQRLELEDSFEDPPKLSIITFNYDNSLEYYLNCTVENKYEGANKLRIRNKLSNIKLIHVHGKLADYSANKEARNITTNGFTSDIKIVSDKGVEQSEEFTAARNLVWVARRIFVLGFGYDKDNIAHLNLQPGKGKDTAAKMFGTWLGEPDSERIKRELHNDIELAPSGFDCLHALQHWRKYF